jgi:hypothetical protein
LINHQFNKSEPKNNQKKAMCYCRGKKGPYANKCAEKDKKSKYEWAVKKAMMHAQAESEQELKIKIKMITQATHCKSQARARQKRNG